MITTRDSRERVIFEQSTPGGRGYSLPAPDVPAADLRGSVPEGLLRPAIDGFPEVAENDLVRHYVRLSTWNYSVDTGMYPLGSCTMKYNPKVNEAAARLRGFGDLHPMMPDGAAQGALGLMHGLQEML